ncbi:MAG: hypothetical protein IKS07_10070 [Lachnospiraceae bacterium]|nr:hypothetical protein [Lachnospiraceae bacterium]
MAHKFFGKSMIALLTAVSVLAGSCLAGAPLFGERSVARAAAEEINGHAFLTENSAYRLYLNEEDLSVVVEDKATGSFMESSISYDDEKSNFIWLGAMRSAIVLTMINLNSDTTQADLINDENTKKVTKTANGFTAEIYWTKFKIGLTLEVTLTEDGLVARVPEESIREDGTQYFIGTLRIYPFMGCSYLDDKAGYMLVPDGNGALIYLDNKEGRFSSGFSGTIYGTDIGFEESKAETLLWDRYNTITGSETVYAPVFGIAHTEDEIAFLGIVEEGEERCSIDVMPNGVSVDYNRAYARFVLRRMYNQPTSANSTSGSLRVYEDDRSHSDLQVRFLFLSGSQASYAGMAAAYRDYLLKNGQVKSSVDTSYRTRVDFLGTDRENWLLSTTAVVMTTVSDVEEIYEDLRQNGVSGLLSTYKGWQKGGLYDLPINSYKADRKIGGTAALTRLIKDAESAGNQLYLYNNLLPVNPDEQNATFNTIKMVNKKRYEKTTHAEVYETFMYLTPARAQYLLKKFVTGYTKKGVSNLALAGMTDTLYTYYYSGEKHTRFETAQTFEDAVSAVSQDVNLIMETPCAYLWKYTDAFLDMPLYTSSYIIEDESVPFLSLVLKGVVPMYGEYVNFEANKQEFLLKMIESGVYPSFYVTKQDASELIYTNSSDIYSSQYDAFRDTIVSYDAILREVSEKTKGASIINHTIFENGTRLVEYDNGTKICLNYSESAQTVDGITLDAMSYAIR